jgi:ketosteroid isomerase-like protein
LLVWVPASGDALAVIQNRREQMKKLVAVLFACVWVGPVLAEAPKPPSTDQGVADTVKQLAQTFGDAIKDVDTEKIKQILTDDWLSLGSSGRVLTRDAFLSDLKLGYHKLESFQIGPMDVKVLGNVAVVQGTVTEKRTDRGQDTSGHGSFMDVCVKSGDKWVIVRSHSAWVPSAK